MLGEEALPTRTRPTACGYCGYEITRQPVQASSGIRCCSEHCRGRLEAGDEPFVEQAEFKRFRPGVSVLDALLPQGMPTNSFVLLTGDNGIRHRGLQTELLWRRLTNCESAIVITFVDPPIAIVEHFLTFGWNVIPFLESGDLRIIDCFTSRLRQKHQTPTHQAAWNEFLTPLLEDVVSVVRETGNLESIEDSLHTTIEELEMIGEGLVVIDSLNEFEIQGQQSETEQFIKEVRGDICSRKFVPIFTSKTNSENEPFSREYSYLFDGIVAMRHDETKIDDVRFKQLSIQKMDGVLYRPHWVTYEAFGQTGFQIINPNEALRSVYGSPLD